MPDDTKPPAAAPPPRAKTQPPPAAAKPALDERRLRFAELAAFGKQLDLGELGELARDGRAVARANAALGFAAAGHAAPDLVTLVRDSELPVALAAAEAIAELGAAVRPLVTAIVAACETAKPEVTDKIVGALAELVGTADAELIAALDVPPAVANKTIVEACARLGKAGVAFLVRATATERSRSRINAVAGLGRLGKADMDAALACLEKIEAGDVVPDARTAAKQAMLQVVAREKQVAIDRLPKNIPDFEARKLSASELAEYDKQIDVDEMIHALRDGRDHVRVNAARALAVVGERAARAAGAMGLVLRDSVPAVRREVARSLGRLGVHGEGAAPELVGALGDSEPDVADAAGEALAALGARARDAIVKGLEVGGEEHGLRVAALAAKLSDAAELLVEAFKSPAVNVQVNSALALGLLGARGVGKAGLAALHGARTGGDARTRDAVRRALDMIEPKGPAGPRAVVVDGFEDRFVTAAELDKSKAELERVGAGDLDRHLHDGREIVRANAALALGVLGAAAAGSARSLGVLLRDDSARVRLAAAQALDKIGDGAVVETGDDLVGALRDGDDKVAETCAQVIRARKGKLVGALVRGLETDDPRHARRIAEVIGVLPDAQDILCDAIESPAVNVQVNAALALGMLGKDRVGRGRKALEIRRTGGWKRTNEAALAALEVLDGPRRSGPAPVDVDGFETKLLAADAFTDKVVPKLRVDDLVAYTTDGRAIVRANAATALGALGAAALGAATAVGVLCRDDDRDVRIAAAVALDKLGDDAVRECAPYLVGALRGDAEVAKACARVLGARRARVLSALLKGLETDDDAHARRILELVNALPDAGEILVDAFASPAENVQVNAAIGLGMLGEKKAAAAGKKALEGARTGGFARTREAVFKALAMWKA